MTDNIGAMRRIENDPIAREANGNGVHIPTRDEARARRKLERESGFQYPLPYTGGVARVMLPTLATITSYVGLPQDVQEMVLRVFRENAEDAVGANVALTWDRLSKNQDRQMLLANAMVCAGFKSPRVVMTEAELDPRDPHMLTVDDLHVDEKLGFLQLCIGANKTEAARLAPFPVERVRTVEAVPVDAAYRNSTVEAAQAPEIGLQRESLS